MTEAYVKGVPTRSVDDLVAALGVTSGISRSEVSRICAGLDQAVEAVRTRPLSHARSPYIYLDATYLHGRCDHHVVSKAVVIATGVREDGHLEILGVPLVVPKTSSSGGRSCARSKSADFRG